MRRPGLTARIAHRIASALRDAVSGLDPRTWRERRRSRLERQAADDLLLRIASGGGSSFPGRVLIDGTWDNPNYWLRLSLARAALGLPRGEEVGLLGRWRTRECRESFSRLGVSQTVSLVDLASDGVARRRAEAEALCGRLSTAGDLLALELPFGFPPAVLYDGILRRQRRARVDVEDHRLRGWVAELLGGLEVASRLVVPGQTRLVVLSHCVNFDCGSLAWLCALRGVPVLVPYGNYGTCRFIKLTDTAHFMDTVDRPRGGDLDALPPEQAEALARAGWSYLQARAQGRTDDLGAGYAFRKPPDRVDRASVARHFGWPADRPIVAVYASNWFDFPHACGMTHFLDFLDWLEVTLAVATRATGTSWLFKAHPCDEWYGGVTLADLMPRDRPGHVGLAPGAWHGAGVMESIDALVTVHGTAGIELAAMGKPVLVADRGWYDDCGFVVAARSRSDYQEKLAGPWWTDLDRESTSRRARVFAGWYFCSPDWQGRFFTGDDSLQARLYASLPSLVAEAGPVIAREIALLAEWYASGERFYHTYKMRRSSGFATGSAAVGWRAAADPELAAGSP
jgi:hypothetical protein